MSRDSEYVKSVVFYSFNFVSLLFLFFSSFILNCYHHFSIHLNIFLLVFISSYSSGFFLFVYRLLLPVYCFCCCCCYCCLLLFLFITNHNEIYAYIMDKIMRKVLRFEHMDYMRDGEIVTRNILAMKMKLCEKVISLYWILFVLFLFVLFTFCLWTFNEPRQLRREK